MGVCGHIFCNEWRGDIRILQVAMFPCKLLPRFYWPFSQCYRGI